VPNRLIQLLASNRQAPRRFEARMLPAAAADAPAEAEILLYDVIVDSELEAEWWGGVAPEPFVKALRGITADVIHLRINSPGGSVFAARAMETALREHKAKVVVHIDALAASAASFLAMAGEEIIMSKGAMMMIHKAWTLAWGNADELKKSADLLDKIDGTLVTTYADRTGQTSEDVLAMMTAETWFTAQEAIDAGLADSIAAEPAKASAQWNLTAYAHAPAQTPASAPEQSHASADHRARSEQRMRVARVLQPIV
jgi:ATP-dependent Clp protease protease subunit